MASWQQFPSSPFCVTLLPLPAQSSDHFFGVLAQHVADHAAGPAALAPDPVHILQRRPFLLINNHYFQDRCSLFSGVQEESVDPQIARSTVPSSHLAFSIPSHGDFDSASPFDRMSWFEASRSSPWNAVHPTIQGQHRCFESGVASIP